jgi:hypothetical protein
MASSLTTSIRPTFSLTTRIFWKINLLIPAHFFRLLKHEIWAVEKTAAWQEPDKRFGDPL